VRFVEAFVVGVCEHLYCAVPAFIGRPAFMDEYEKLEGELAEEYEVYLEKFRNLDYLEHELDLYNRVRGRGDALLCWSTLTACPVLSRACASVLQREKEKMEAAGRALKRLQKKLRDEEFRMFIGDGVRGVRVSACLCVRSRAAQSVAATPHGAVAACVGAGG
jgi:hypothetical protein